jgi:hypothetical protein
MRPVGLCICMPDNATVEFDFFPDVSQYPADCLFDTGFTLPGGADGPALRQHLRSVGPQPGPSSGREVWPRLCGGVRCLRQQLVAGQRGQRSLSDYNSKIKPYTTSSAYIHQGGKPVVMAFGIGYTTRALSATDAENLINQMKSAGAYVGIGTPTNWASLVSSNPTWAPVMKAANLISP